MQEVTTADNLYDVEAHSSSFETLRNNAVRLGTVVISISRQDEGYWWQPALNGDPKTKFVDFSR